MYDPSPAKHFDGLLVHYRGIAVNLAAFIRRLTNVSIEKGDKEKHTRKRQKKTKRHERKKKGTARREREESSHNTLTGSPTAFGGSRVAM